MSAEWQLSFCKRVKWAMFALTRFPVFELEQVRLFFQRHSRPEEVRQYMDSSSQTARKRSMALVAAYLLYSLKQALNPMVTFLVLDLSNQSVRRAANRSSSSSSHSHFACLSTNCTRLSSDPRGLGHDLASLHLLNLCYPALDAIYGSPVAKLDLFGAFVASLSAFGTLTLGAWPNIEQLLFKSGGRSIMFVCAPQLTRNQLLVRARAYLDDLFGSLRHFEAKAAAYNLIALPSGTLSLPSDLPGVHQVVGGEGGRVRRRVGRRRRQTADDKTMWLINYYRQQLRERQEHEEAGQAGQAGQANRRDKRQVDQQPLGDPHHGPAADKLTDAQLDDCLPLVRSHLWQPHFVHMWCYSTMASLTLVSLVVVLALGYIQSQLGRKAHLYGHYSREMSRANCSLWPTDRPDEPIHLEQVSFGWTVVALMEMAVMNLTPTLGGALLLVYFHIGYNCEISLWLDEMLAHLSSSQLALSRLRCLEGARQQWWVRRTRASIAASTHFNRLFAYRTTASAASSNSNSDNLQDPSDNSHQVSADLSRPELQDLEVVYVQFRLFLEHVSSCAPGVVIVITLTYLLNYGVLVISVLFARQSARREFVAEPTSVVLFCFSLANILLLISSKLHAKANRLQPIIWSMVASLTVTRDLRLRHMRTLWLRQLEYLQSDGGITLTALGIRITYVNNIQLIIWTATILVLTIPAAEQR